MRYSSGGTGYGGVVLGIHHAQNVIYYACPCPLRGAQVGNLDTHANCVKGECGVGNTPRTGHGYLQLCCFFFLLGCIPQSLKTLFIQP